MSNGIERSEPGGGGSLWNETSRDTKHSEVHSPVAMFRGHGGPRYALKWALVLLPFGYLWLRLINNLRLEWATNPQYSYGWVVP